MIKEKKKRMLMVGSLILLILLSFLGYYFWKYQMIKQNISFVVTKEYGEGITIEDFFNSDSLKASTDVSLKELKDIGDYEIKLKIESYLYHVKASIIDTTAPLVVVQDLERYIDEDLPAIEDFIVSISDVSSYTIEGSSIQKILGEQEVSIIIKDNYQNVTEEKAKLTLKEDKEPPAFKGLSYLTIEVGESADLKIGVTAQDERFGSVSYTVDDSKVNYNTPGLYKVYYTASDSLGNEVTSSRTLQILPKEITYQIANFPTFNQYPNYPNGCESAALYNLLRFYKVDVTMEDIVSVLKKGEGPYDEGLTRYGGNPELEFVGDPKDNTGYGVYQKPILEVANKFKTGMVDYTGHSLNSVLSLVEQGFPVQVWVSINLVDTEVYDSWIYKPTGEVISWLGDLHSVVIIGFNRQSVLVSDSFTGQIKRYNRTQFNKIYNLFGQRALYYPN